MSVLGTFNPLMPVVAATVLETRSATARSPSNTAGVASVTVMVPAFVFLMMRVQPGGTRSPPPAAALNVRATPLESRACGAYEAMSSLPLSRSRAAVVSVVQACDQFVLDAGRWQVAAGEFFAQRRHGHACV